ncbi:MAG: glycoside hydrolase family 16 [Chitinophagaceae bacterium]|nr:glycoside hydrolase family 16 [Chitinophagaceae bacterium]
MRNYSFFGVLFALIIFSSSGQAQSWDLEWSDEFNGSISSNWVFETGAGGWGNNELEYYRRENASVEDGKLVITARHENYGGAQYTSARMKTQGKKYWKYGKIEARIAMPAFQGIWPAFWMLGENISSVGWPNCGEIDIMEHINDGGNVHGTIHWLDNTGNHAQYTGSTSTSVTSYHTYAVEWDASAIRWYVDGVKYHEANIANSINGTSELHENFFILLNLAVGGDWPGSSVNNSGMPAKMYVDYVRVYKQGSAPAAIATVYKDCDFGGSAVGLPAGDYNLSALQAHGVKNDDISSFHLQSGYEMVLYDNSDFSGASLTRSSNINCLVDEGWNDRTSSLRIRKVTTSSFTRTIQAESYSEMAGVQLENTTDAGGGQDVGWIDTGDWMAYKDINFPSSGSYKVEYRVAGNGGKLSLDLNSGSKVLGALNVPSTGGWQNWTTISHTVSVTAGTYKLGIYAATGGWNLNWIKITKVSSARSEDDAEASSTDAPSYAVAINAYPNPTENNITINMPVGMQNCNVKITDLAGNNIRETTLNGNTLDISDLKSGVYILLLDHDGQRTPLRVVKQ